jgi:methylglutaconyl-CoA hydratase
MTEERPVLIEHKHGVVTVTMNRPASHNAFDPQMIGELTAAFLEFGSRDDVRVVILTGRGRSFCAGADLSMMRAASNASFNENVSGANAIFDLMSAVDGCPRPVVGRINGAAIGGGAGLVSCCDIVIAVERARFGFSETRIGLVPAVISPFVLAKIGSAQGREYFLTGELFDAHHAQVIGLVNYVVAEERLDAKVAERVAALLLAAPGAQEDVKALIRAVRDALPESFRDYASNLIASRRSSPEGREGMAAFLEKREPNWRR